MRMHFMCTEQRQRSFHQNCMQFCDWNKATTQNTAKKKLYKKKRIQNGMQFHASFYVVMGETLSHTHMFVHSFVALKKSKKALT